MKIIHRFSANQNPAFREFLEQSGIPYQRTQNNLVDIVVLEVAESDPHWSALASAHSRFDVLHHVGASFSDAEVQQAHWTRLLAAGNAGYPEPSGDSGYQTVTYASFCSGCGIHGEQMAPFRLRKAPTMRRSHLFQLNWVFDEFFVSPEASRILQAAGLRGFRFSSPVLHRSGTPITTWLQMHVTDTLPAAVASDSLSVQTCSTCGTRKFAYPQAEMLHLRATALSAAPDIVRTAEWFGPGAMAYRAVLVSKRFLDTVRHHDLRGFAFTPVSLDATNGA